jgi:hypothetical protein
MGSSNEQCCLYVLRERTLRERTGKKHMIDEKKKAASKCITVYHMQTQPPSIEA